MLQIIGYVYTVAAKQHDTTPCIWKAIQDKEIERKHERMVYLQVGLKYFKHNISRNAVSVVLCTSMLKLFQEASGDIKNATELSMALST